MEIHLFKTRDVDQKLDEIMSLLHLLQHSIIGFEAVRTLNERDACGILLTIDALLKITGDLHSSRRLISRKWDTDVLNALIRTD